MTNSTWNRIWGINNPFEEGQFDYQRGATREQNPYNESEVGAIEWAEGWELGYELNKEVTLDELEKILKDTVLGRDSENYSATACKLRERLEKEIRESGCTLVDIPSEWPEIKESK